jgi:Fe-S-cluster-containing hydrogenase component 2
MIVIKNAAACTGCLICEMVCSFHHIGKYSRTSSSIKVDKSLFGPEKGAKIAILLEKTEGGPLCDLCKKEESPLCVKFCPENVLGIEGGSK